MYKYVRYIKIASVLSFAQIRFSQEITEWTVEYSELEDSLDCHQNIHHSSPQKLVELFNCNKNMRTTDQKLVYQTVGSVSLRIAGGWIPSPQNPFLGLSKKNHIRVCPK